MINRNTLYPTYKPIFYRVEDDYFEDDLVAEVDVSGFDRYYIIPSGPNAKSITVLVQGGAPCNSPPEPSSDTAPPTTIPPDDLDLSRTTMAWQTISSGALPVATGADPAPDTDDEFSGERVMIDCAGFSKLRFTVSAATGPVSLWGGGAMAGAFPAPTA